MATQAQYILVPVTIKTKIILFIICLLYLNLRSQQDSLWPKLSADSILKIKYNLHLINKIDSIKLIKKEDSIYNIKYKKEKVLSQVNLHKYYIYADAWDFLRGAAFHLQFNVLTRRWFADYIDVSLGYRHDDDWVKNYTKLSGEYYLRSSIAYILLKNKRFISYECSFGATTHYGDPVARDSYQTGFNGSKFLFYNNITLAIRYTLKKIPIQIRPSVSVLFIINRKQYLPFFPSISIGYGLKKLNNAQNVKLQTYSNTNN